VVPNVNGHDPVAIEAAIEAAKQAGNRPSMICCKTVIGMGSPNKADTHEVHGAALGAAEIAAARPHIGWNHLPFEIPQDVYEMWDARAKGTKLEDAWNRKFAEYAEKYPAEAAEFTRRISGQLPEGWSEHVDALIARVHAKEETIASRKASQNAIEGLAPQLPELVGGSADLAGSNLTLWSNSKGIDRDAGGNYIYYGVREFGMSAIMNGLSLHGGIIPYGATFLMFSEYARNALRMAALMKIRNLFVFTHDSIGLGEDGPTHQPVEQTATLRYIPNMDVWRPCDTVESTVSWARAIERRDGPSILIFSRQNLPFQKRDSATIKLIDKGGYILSEAADGKPRAIIIATGSEVGLAMMAQKALAETGVHVRVVSMPCTNLFDRQDPSYKGSVLPKGVGRVAVEAGVTDYWRKYVGLEGAVVGMDTFGESAPASDLFKHFGFTVENVVKAVNSVI
jgi:transketolase